MRLTQISAIGNNTLADMIMKNCSATHQCTTATANFGITKLVISNQCCNTNLCNTQTEIGMFNTGGRIFLFDIKSTYLIQIIYLFSAYFLALTMHVSQNYPKSSQTECTAILAMEKIVQQLYLVLIRKIIVSRQLVRFILNS